MDMEIWRDSDSLYSTFGWFWFYDLVNDDNNKNRITHRDAKLKDIIICGFTDL